MRELHFKSISEFHKFNNFPEPENPLFSVIHLKNTGTKKCDYEDAEHKFRITNQFYSISMKNIVSGELVYGRTKYDGTKGSMFFMAPNQTVEFNDLIISSDAFHIAFHKDFIIGAELHKKLKSYNYFNYSVNEALHLSPKEEDIIKTIFNNLENEYRNNQDEFSKEIILSHLGTLLKYADRFYKRQFLNRKEINKALFTRFKDILNRYFDTNQLEEKGIPTVEWLAKQLGVSQRYMSDTIKTETGKTAIDQINLYLIDEAKNLLLAPNASVSETAYKLGFEYPQYFSRLFKKKTGLSPKKYIEQAALN